MTPGTYNFSVVRGTTQPFQFKITIVDPNDPPNRIPIPNTSIVLSIKSGSATLHKSTIVNGSGLTYDNGTGIVTWTPTAAETRAFKLTPENSGAPIPNTYEIEVRDGASQMVYLQGAITATGGINDD